MLRAGFELGDDAIDEVEPGRVEGARVLEQDDARFLEEDAGEGGALAHAGGERRDHVVAARAEADAVEERRHTVARDAEMVGDHLEVFAGRQRFVQIVLVRQERRQFAHVFTVADDVESADVTVPRSGRMAVASTPQRRLPGAVPPATITTVPGST